MLPLVVMNNDDHDHRADNHRADYDRNHHNDNICLTRNSYNPVMFVSSEFVLGYLIEPLVSHVHSFFRFSGEVKS